MNNLRESAASSFVREVKSTVDVISLVGRIEWNFRESEIAKRANFEKIKKLGDSMTLPPEELKPLVADANDFDFNTRKMMKTNLLSG